ncbi:hypothetical protein F5Y09DRAFT_28291 [Xylaria sp. FL1042]|nr:hypothetical protein F5Y09DRAFT_28291 [Xylaria sp. FL1042]
METHDQNPSCLSTHPHDDNITDPILHYFGCLEAWQRDSFLNAACPYWTREVEKLKDSGLRYDEAVARVITKRVMCREDCSKELRRVSLVLAALAKDDNQSRLVRSLASSREQWRCSQQYKSGIELVRKWRARRGIPNGVTFLPLQNAIEGLFNLDKLMVHVMAFENGTPHNIDSQCVTGTFPNQSTNVGDLLRHDTSELFELLREKKNDRSSATLTWIHIPSNNMLWIEELIASYYGEGRLSRDQMRHGDEASRAARILREFFWKGQQYGDPTKPGSRFMRPFCEFIAPSRSYMDSETEKVVLYAPFLHWETSRQLTLVRRRIKENLTSYMNAQRLKADSERQKRIKEREGLQPAASASWWPFSFKTGLEGRPKGGLRLFKHEGRRYQSNSLLGQYLLDVARLYEEVRNYEDTFLIQKYLFADPPLHPRRTLDQGYYTTVQTTRSKDRNQVVYRATTPANTSYHHYDCSRNRWECSGDDLSPEGCDKCRANIRKVSSVVMVDQLWMWVLDPGVIITCFPKRYGIRGHDPSGVFEAIQRRLVRNRPLHSVFAIAQTVLDECSNTFFGRMKDFNGQPPVLDIFSEAIQNVSRKQTIESHRLWDWIDRARRINRQQEPHGNIDIPTWNMSAEGELEQEIQDIIEELEIMISVNNTQLDVCKKFISHASSLIKADSGGCTWRDEELEALQGGPKLIARVEERIRFLESMLKTASNASDQVKDLSQLRQQQDSVIQALQSVKLSRDSIDQGRTIMVFTIVTIIFSPLSFLSSIFGMNNAEFGDNQWKVTDQLKLILSISVSVTALALVFASRRVRSAAIYIATIITHPFHTLWRSMRLLSMIFVFVYVILGSQWRASRARSTGAPSTTAV